MKRIYEKGSSTYYIYEMFLLSQGLTMFFTSTMAFFCLQMKRTSNKMYNNSLTSTLTQNMYAISPITFGLFFTKYQLVVYTSHYHVSSMKSPRKLELRTTQVGKLTPVASTKTLTRRERDNSFDHTFNYRSVIGRLNFVEKIITQKTV